MCINELVFVIFSEFHTPLTANVGSLISFKIKYDVAPKIQAYQLIFFILIFLEKIFHISHPMLSKRSIKQTIAQMEQMKYQIINLT